jgi:PAS domain-containing protein
MQVHPPARPPSSDPDLRLALAHADVAARDGAVGGVLGLVLVAFVYPAIAVGGSDDATPPWLALTLVAIVASLATCGWWIRARATRARGSAGERMQDERVRVRRWTVIHRAAALATGLAWGLLVFAVDRPTESDVLVTALVLAAAGIVAFVAQRSDRTTFALAAAPIALAQAYDLATFGGTAVPLAIVWLIVAYLLARMQRLSARDDLVALVEGLDASRDAREHQATIDAVPLAVLVVRGTQIVSCNRELVALFGYEDASARAFAW